MYKWECSICGKQPEHFGIKEFAMSPRTTLFGEFNFRDADGNIRTVNRNVNKPVCSEECKRKNEEQYFVEEYKGTRIYCIDGRYMTYLECDYCYDSIQGIRNRIDNPHLIPVAPNLLSALRGKMRE